MEAARSCIRYAAAIDIWPWRSGAGRALLVLGRTWATCAGPHSYLVHVISVALTVDP